MKKIRSNSSQFELFNDTKTESFANAKPFLKWAGGKSQLIEEIELIIPKKLKDHGRYTYVEPFIGSGALMFHLLKKYPSKIDFVIINDTNTILTSIYKYLKNEPENILKILKTLKDRYLNYSLEEDRKNYFLELRSNFNSIKSNSIEKACLMIFLNKTCFNGLYRVNSRNEFNVPFGSYKNPSIYDESVMVTDSKLLQRVKILEGDFEETLESVNGNTLFYFDPPYKPISTTSSFNSYSSDIFDDNEQKRLKAFCDKITSSKFNFILSNSDLKNINPEDNFFDDLYKDYKIKRVPAKRSINSDSTQRGQIFELLITNANYFVEW